MTSPDNNQAPRRPDPFTILSGLAALGIGILLVLVVQERVELSGGWLAAAAAAAVGVVLVLGDALSGRR